MDTQKIIRTHALLKYAYGAVLLVIGLDKLFRTDLIVNWEGYVAPFVSSVVPIGPFLVVMAVIEIVVAIMLLSKWTRIAAYLSVAWLVLITVDLLMLGLVDIAARDILLAVGALALAWLSEATSGSQTAQA